MLKIPATLIVLALWANYAAGKDTKPVGKSVHTAIYCCYLAFAAAAWVFVP